MFFSKWFCFLLTASFPQYYVLVHLSAALYNLAKESVVKNTLSKEMLFQQGTAPSHFHVSFWARLLRIEIFHDNGFAEVAVSLGHLVSLTLKAHVFYEYPEDTVYFQPLSATLRHLLW
jgi:hypothetical protein